MRAQRPNWQDDLPTEQLPVVDLGGHEMPRSGRRRAASTSVPFYRRSGVLAVFAVVGLSILAVIGGYAFSGDSEQPSSAAAETSTAQSVSSAAPASVPPPAVPAPKPVVSTTTTSKPPVRKPPPVSPPVEVAGPSTGRVVGTIATVANNALTIATSSGAKVTVSTNASTQFVQSEKRTGEQFGVGSPVVVTGDREPDFFLAERITALDSTDDLSSAETVAPTTTEALPDGMSPYGG